MPSTGGGRGGFDAAVGWLGVAAGTPLPAATVTWYVCHRSTSTRIRQAPYWLAKVLMKRTFLPLRSVGKTSMRPGR